MTLLVIWFGLCPPLLSYNPKHPSVPSSTDGASWCGLSCLGSEQARAPNKSPAQQCTHVTNAETRELNVMLRKHLEPAPF